MVWRGLHQSDWGMPYPKPTRLLARLKGRDSILCVGPPTFNEKGGYKGPLARIANPTATIIGKSSKGQFKTGPAAAWPPALCDKLAELIISDFSSEGDETLPEGRTEEPSGKQAMSDNSTDLAAEHGDIEEKEDVAPELKETKVLQTRASSRTAGSEAAATADSGELQEMIGAGKGLRAAGRTSGERRS